MNCDPNELSKAASCYLCLPDDILSAAKTSLLCSWANAVVTPPPVGGGFILMEDGFFILQEDGVSKILLE